MAPKDPIDPVVFKIPALGHAVRLGELYDQKSGLFLGASLYPEENIDVIETDVRHTDLTVSLSTTLEDKASLLDISAKLSLDIMSGMVSVSGSASYVKDTKSNTNEQAFALALKMRLNEKRILFTEDKLGRNILKVASEDYLANGSATHFVSAITYGGSLVVNLIARKGKLSTDEQLEGELEAKFNHLKGAISISGSAKVKTQDKFDSLDDKFDLTIYGDVTLDQVPTNPKDVLEIIPQGAAMIMAAGGVPISATLQPIPEKLLMTATKIYEIEAIILDQIFVAFSLLDDLRSRFAVLIDGAKSVEEFVPELARTARATQNQYTEDHGSLLHDLRNFLYDYQHGETDADSETVLSEARKLYNHHIEGADKEGAKDEDEEDDDEEDDDKGPLSQYYPSTLVGLERELARFRNFVADMQKLRDFVMSLDENCKAFVSFSSIDYITRAIRLQNAIPLFVMPPITPMHPDRELPPGTSLDLIILHLLSMLRANTSYFNDSSNPARILYAETIPTLKSRLPKLAAEISFEKPSFLIGTVDKKGVLSWSSPSQRKELSLKLVHQSSLKTRTDLSYGLTPVDGTKSFSLQIWAEPIGTSANDSVICRVQCTEPKKLFLQFETPLQVVIHRYYGDLPLKSESGTPTGKFVVTLVQDLDNLIWYLYLGKEKVDYVSFTSPAELLIESTSVELSYMGDKWWNGRVNEVRAFSYALTQKQIEDMVG